MFGWMKKNGNGRIDRATRRAAGHLLITGQSGFVGGINVASNLGWRPVDSLSVGDKVLTFDHGMREIVDIQREVLGMTGETARRVACVHVPQDALVNRRDLWLMPEQGLLLESNAVSDILGDPFAILPAKALDGFRGIEMAEPPTEIEVTTLAFRHDELIYVEGGMLAYCPRPRSFLVESPDDAPVLYRTLDFDIAQALIEDMNEQDNPMALVCDPEEICLVAMPRGKPHDTAGHRA